MFNTIILWKTISRLTEREFKDFHRGDAAMEHDGGTEELCRGSIGEKDAAYAELRKHKNEYYLGNQVKRIEEYGLEFCEYNEDGEYVNGSDYDFAEDDPEHPFMRFWFAKLSADYDDWDDGTFDENEARKYLENRRTGDAIAVIEDVRKICVAECFSPWELDRVLAKRNQLI